MSGKSIQKSPRARPVAIAALTRVCELLLASGTVSPETAYERWVTSSTSYRAPARTSSPSSATADGSDGIRTAC